MSTEALELDIKILEQLAAEEKEEEIERNKRKEKERLDAEEMRDIMRQQLLLEIERERELDTMYREEADRQWSRCEADWERERKARESLMEEVLLTRAQQLEDKMADLKQQQLENIERREDLLRELEMVAQLTARDDRRRADEQKRLQKELKTQIAEAKLAEHWRSNCPQLQEVESRCQQRLTHKTWQEQITKKREVSKELTCYYRKYQLMNNQNNIRDNFDQTDESEDQYEDLINQVGEDELSLPLDGVERSSVTVCVSNTPPFIIGSSALVCGNISVPPPPMPPPQRASCSDLSAPTLFTAAPIATYTANIKGSSSSRKVPSKIMFADVPSTLIASKDKESFTSQTLGDEKSTHIIPNNSHTSSASEYSVAVDTGECYQLIVSRQNCHHTALWSHYLTHPQTVCDEQRGEWILPKAPVLLY